MKIALAIPHLTTNQERAENMRVLRKNLGITPGFNEFYYQEFTEKAPWHERMLTRWEWALKTQAEYMLALEDDVLVPDFFWASLKAMLQTWPDELIGLSATHSLGPSVASQGRRSYYTPKLLGWAWVCPMSLLVNLYDYAKSGKLDKFVKEQPVNCEDGFIINALFHVLSGVTGRVPETGGIRYPVPTICDHNLSFSTTNPLMRNQESDSYTHMRASVSWRGFAREDLCEPNWWAGPSVKLPVEHSEPLYEFHGACAWCGLENGIHKSPKHENVVLCRGCFMAPYMRTDIMKMKVLV